MPSFSELFMKSKGTPIEYNGKILTRIDNFPVSNGDRLHISIEKTNREDIQGISIDIKGSCELNGKLYEEGKGVNMIFWENATAYSPKSFEVTIFTKEKFVRIKNIWEHINDIGQISVDSGRYGSAMIVEEIENGRRYRCNDWHPDENFDDIVFTVQKLKQ